MKIIGDEENLKNEILQDADRKNKQAVKKAGVESKKIIKQANQEAKEKYDEIKNHALEQAEKAKQRILSSIPQAVKKKNIKMMNSLVDEVMDNLDAKFSAMNNKEIKTIEMRLLEQSLEKLEKGEYQINISDKSLITQNDLKEYEIKYNVKLNLKKHTGQDYGVIISGSDNRIAIDNTINGKIKRDIEDVRYIIYDTLFSEIKKKLKNTE